MTRKVLKITPRRLGGRYIVDIRRFENERPTKRGVSIPQDSVQDTIRQLEEAWRDNESRRHQTATKKSS